MRVTLNKKYMCLFGIAIGTIALSLIFLYLGKTPKLIIGLGTILFIMTWALWHPPERHKAFTDRDRLQAMSRALGGSPPPEIATHAESEQMRVPHHVHMAHHIQVGFG